MAEVQAEKDTTLTVKQDPNPTTQTTPNVFRRHRKCCICCAVTAAVILVLVLVLVLVIVILSLTVFKTKDPTFTTDSVMLENIVASLIPPPSANLTLIITLTVHNPNIASFEYENSTAHIFYRDIEVGYAPILAGEMEAHSTKNASSSLTIELAKFVSEPLILIQDVLAGAFPMTVNSVLSGKVNIFNIVKKHVTASSSCTTTVFANLTAGPLDCQYYTKGL